MWLKCDLRLFVVLLFLMVQRNVAIAAQANNVAQLKNQQHQQTSMSQPNQHHAPTPIQQQHTSTHPGSSSGNSNSMVHHLGTASPSLSSGTLLSNAAASALPLSQASTSSSAASNLPPAQFVDKEAAMQEVLKHFSANVAATDEDLSDSYQILKELKREVTSSQGQAQQTQQPPPPPPLFGMSNNYPWNLYERGSYGPLPYHQMPIPSMSPFAGLFPHLFNPYDAYQQSSLPVTPRFLPFMGYAQPILVPYPFYMAPEMFYPGFSTPTPSVANEFEDSMSRGAGSQRRPSSSSRNSPIYYVRLPPTPYMFLPSLGLGTATTTGFPAMVPYQSLPSFSPFSSIFNVPINFLANGKPGNVYQMGGLPNDVQNSLPYTNIPGNFANRPAPSSNSQTVNSGYRPPSTLHNYYNGSPPPLPSHNYGGYGAVGLGASSATQQPLPDSRLTSLKRPYFFNGRPDDIYVLPNNFNPLYSSDNSYY
ncbi:uncharacterized protein LOC142221820 [Haematobia irritans]|uniref:uncharacterized protein LOC142221820 n=1 Tax=Haematobia irritans TaxID=7368 RepID=UPI003F500CC2